MRSRAAVPIVLLKMCGLQLLTDRRSTRRRRFPAVTGPAGQAGSRVGQVTTVHAGIDQRGDHAPHRVAFPRSLGAALTIACVCSIALLASPSLVSDRSPAAAFVAGGVHRDVVLKFDNLATAAGGWASGTATANLAEGTAERDVSSCLWEFVGS
jgi:hypothetical protein